MERELLKNLNEYFNKINDPTDEEKYILLRIQGELPFFKITTVHRDDLESKGFDASQVDDEIMQELASKMADDYCEQLFWDSLPIIAEILKIPEKGTVYCPKCNAVAEFDEAENLYYCMKCEHEWQDLPESSNQ